MRTRLIAIGILLLFGAATMTMAQNAKILFDEAFRKERGELDFEGAIKIYLRVVSESKDRALIASALLRLGACYEQLGETKGRAYYDQVIKEYPDQKASVAEAQLRLAAPVKN